MADRPLLKKVSKAITRVNGGRVRYEGNKFDMDVFSFRALGSHEFILYHYKGYFTLPLHEKLHTTDPSSVYNKIRSFLSVGKNDPMMSKNYLNEEELSDVWKLLPAYQYLLSSSYDSDVNLDKFGLYVSRKFSSTDIVSLVFYWDPRSGVVTPRLYTNFDRFLINSGNVIVSNDLDELKVRLKTLEEHFFLGGTSLNHEDFLWGSWFALHVRGDLCDARRVELERLGFSWFNNNLVIPEAMIVEWIKNPERARDITARAGKLLDQAYKVPCA